MNTKLYYKNYSDYQLLFDEILKNTNPSSPYDDEGYLNYTKLNRSRMRRWDKQLVLSEKIITVLKEISTPQHWIIITEPWCGDASHVVPFLIRMTEQNDLITYDIQLRDAQPFLIDQYLTNGGKSIPKLVVRDAQGNDLLVWGPRPEGAATLYANLKVSNTDFEQIKIALQNWYNDDKGDSLYTELSEQLLELTS